VGEARRRDGELDAVPLEVAQGERPIDAGEPADEPVEPGRERLHAGWKRLLGRREPGADPEPVRAHRRAGLPREPGGRREHEDDDERRRREDQRGAGEHAAGARRRDDEERGARERGEEEPEPGWPEEDREDGAAELPGEALAGQRLQEHLEEVARRSGRLEERLQARLARRQGLSELVREAREPVEAGARPGRAGLPPVLRGRSGGGGDRSRGGAADAPEPVLPRELEDGAWVDHAARDPTLHDEVTLGPGAGDRMVHCPMVHGPSVPWQFRRHRRP
jgi:hypothetical protein